jgi:uncharacterized Zn finger protein (UPF0148 family)
MNDDAGLGGGAMTEISCPQCGRSLPYVEELAGRIIFCLGCGAHFAIPGQDAAAPPGSKERQKLLFLDMPPESPAGEPGGGSST